jgi:hypothetical protein
VRRPHRSLARQPARYQAPSAPINRVNGAWYKRVCGGMEQLLD